MSIVSMTPEQWEQLFDKSDFTWIGNHKTKTYSFDCNGEYYFVISAKGRGTSIETNADAGKYMETGKPTQELKDKVNNFIEFLYDKLLTLNDEKVNFWKDKEF